MGATLALKQSLVTFLDLSDLSRAVGFDPEQIEKIELRYGKTRARVSELFRVEPNSTGELALTGDLRLAINAGEGLLCGAMRVKSGVSHNAGRRMQGGRLYIEGDAGENACNQMQEGFVSISGNAGDNACRRMRRGVAVIGGFTGRSLGYEMLGGTLVSLGKIENPEGGGVYIGLDMDRGTIILPANTDAPPGFTRISDCDLVFLRLLFLSLRDAGVPIPQSAIGGVFTRWRGDALRLNKGELFIPQGAKQ
ncbi:MAG: hypothetical protein AAGU74_05370 [Bacillota bacterium]